MKAALFCLLLVAGTQICRAYPTFGLGQGGGHGVEKSIEDKVSQGSDCEDDGRQGEHGSPGSSHQAPLSGGSGGPSIPGGPSTPVHTAVNTVKDTVNHEGNAVELASHRDINGASQEGINGSDSAAVGGSKIMNSYVPGSGTVALTAYSVPSVIAHSSAAGVSGMANLATGGALSGN